MKPTAWLRFWAAQLYVGQCNIGCDEGYEVCKEGDKGVDGSPAFPVFAAPIDIMLHCPACGLHLCHGCDHIWRPADVATNGVKVIETRGNADDTPPEKCKMVRLTDAESVIRKKIVQELRSSAFLHTDVNKEHVLLAIEHGGTEWHKHVTPPDDELEPLTPGLLAKMRASIPLECVPRIPDTVHPRADELTKDEIDDIIKAINAAMNPAAGMFFPRGWNIILNKLCAMAEVKK